jgi:Bacterial TSP3 repeat
MSLVRALPVLAGVAVLAASGSVAEARPRDTDRDGLTDRHERKRSHTNPRRADTDRDRLRDRFELRRSNTNPRKRDTDGDGVSDRRELRRGTNPRRKPRGRKRQAAPPSAPLREAPPRALDRDEVLAPGPAAPQPHAAAQPPAPSSAFPTPATTGVPDGWRPSATHNGTLTVSQAGTQINGMLVTGSIEVRAPNVTIRNSRVYGRIYNQANNTMYNGLLVEDTEIGPDSGNNNQTAGSLGSGGYVARRVHIHNSTEGFRVGGFNYSRGVAGPVVIQDSFVDLDDNGSCAHADGVQEFDWGPRLDINHNTIDMRNVGCSTAPIYLNNAGPKTVTNNLIMGGSYSLRLHGGGSYEAVAGNRLVQGAWDHGPVLVDSCTGIANWSDNRLVSIDAAYNITTLGGLITRC